MLFFKKSIFLHIDLNQYCQEGGIPYAYAQTKAAGGLPHRTDRGKTFPDSCAYQQPAPQTC